MLPLDSPVLKGIHGSGRNDEALGALREAAEMNSNSQVVYNWLSWTYDKKGMIPQSIEMDLKDEAVQERVRKRSSS